MNSSGKQQKGLTVPERSYGYQPAAQTEGQQPDQEGCGFFCLQPRWMRPLGNRVTYLLVYCACGLVQGMWYTYFVSILTTVEKTFKFPSSVTGIILAGNDVAQIFFAVLISYYGGRGHRPRWVGAGMLMNALGCLLSALPQFVWGPDPSDVAAAMTGTSFNSSVKASPSNTLCSLSAGELTSPATPVTDCAAEGDVSLVPVILLFVSQFVSGVGATAYYTLGLTYLDDSVDKKQSPVMFAITAGLRVMGPMLGFMLGSFSLSNFVIPSLQPAIKQKDPRWIGAWWLGFFVLAGLLTLVSSLMCLFPRNLRQQAVQAETESSEPADGILMKKMDRMMGSMDELHTGARPAEQLKNMDSLKNALLRLFHNPLLMVMLLNVVFAIIGFIGYFTYMPKYQMAAFRQSASRASLFSGLSGVLVTLVGYIGSGVVIKFLQPRAVFVTGYSALVNGVQTVCMFALMAVRCDQVPLHGTAGDGQFLLTADCNAGCGCGQDKMSPVCSEDGLASFFSPCFAGCQTASNVNGSVLYGNCSCIVEVESGKAGGGIFSHLATATSGLCELPCDSFVTYMIILAFMKFVGSTNRTGGMLVFFRSVADKDKSLAIGMATALMSIFAFIPAPIVFGAVVDETCLIWEQKPCGGRGNCLHYDIDKLRVYLHTAVIIPFTISFVLDMAVIYLARNVQLYGEDGPKKAAKKSTSNGAALDVPM